MSQISIISASSLLSADTLDQPEQYVVQITDIDLISKLQSGNILSKEPLIAVDFSDLDTLSIPNFTVIFVRDFGNNGSGSLWWKHPTLGIKPVNNNIEIAISNQIFEGLWHTGDADPAHAIIKTITLPKILENSSLIIQHYAIGSEGSEFKYTLNYKKKLDGQAAIWQHAVAFPAEINQMECKICLNFYTQTDQVYHATNHPGGTVSISNLGANVIDFSYPVSIDLSIKPAKVDGSMIYSLLYNAYYKV